MNSERTIVISTESNATPAQNFFTDLENLASIIPFFPPSSSHSKTDELILV
jgi:hypothetical protein